MCHGASPMAREREGLLMCHVQIVHDALRRASFADALCLIKFLILDIVGSVAALAQVERLRRKHAVVLGWAVINVWNLMVGE